MAQHTGTTASSEVDPAEWRSEFPIVRESTYLISNSLGAMPRSTRASLAEYADIWNSRGVRAWEEAWWAMPAEIADLIGRLLGCPGADLSLHQNVTIAEWIVLSCLRPTPQRNRVVYSELNFPSIRYFYQAQPDLQPVVVPCPDGVTVPVDALVDAIDERTLLVPISHVLFRSSYIQQVEAVIEKAHDVGARVILDVYQSAGALPLDLRKLNVDFATGGSVKWLCGGPGVAFLYVREDLGEKLEPRLTGWMAHERPFGFEPEMKYTSGSYRFLNGTPQIPALYAAREGYRIVGEVGVEAIRRHSQKLTERLIERADAAGFPIHSPRRADRRCGHVSIEPPNAERVCRQLLERDFVVDYRPGVGVRVAPHFYNTADEIDAVVEEMQALVGR